MLSRRAFLQKSSLVSLSPLLPSILATTARAAGAAADARALVVIQLDGGNDGINTVVPYADDAYGRVRDKLRLDVDRLHVLDDQAALHASMRAAKELYDDGRLAIVQGVGYPNPSRSHFRSMRIWHTARPDEPGGGYGWLGRALDRAVAASGGSQGGDAVYVGDQDTPVALWGRQSSAVALARADDLHLQLNARLPTESMPDGTGSLSQFVSRQVLSAYAAAEEFQKSHDGATSDVAGYPQTRLAERLRLVAQLLKSGSHARVFYTVQPGYDTHAAQLYTHARLLRELSEALKAFMDDLQAAGLDDRVLVLAFSEFGRRVQENASQGTDHGTAGPVLLAGPSVSGGLVGQVPSLEDLDEGDLKMQFDFRQVYATILDRWLGVPSVDVLGTSLASMPVLRAT